MASCPTCHQPAATRDGFDRRGRQRFACHLCHRDFAHAPGALRRGDVALWCLAPGYRPQLATRGDRARAVAAAMVTLAARLNKAA